MLSLEEIKYLKKDNKRGWLKGLILHYKEDIDNKVPYDLIIRRIKNETGIEVAYNSFVHAKKKAFDSSDSEPTASKQKVSSKMNKVIENHKSTIEEQNQDNKPVLTESIKPTKTIKSRGF